MKLSQQTPILLMALLGSCSQPSNNASQLDSSIAGNHPTLGRIGLGYDPDTNRIYPAANRCVTGDTEQTSNREEGELQYTSNMSTEALKGRIYAGGSLSLDMPTWKVGGSGSYLKDHSSSKLSTTYNYVLTVMGPDRGYKVGEDDTINTRLSAYGYQALQRELAGEFGYFAKVCGSEYISQIKYGASLFFTLRIDYFNEEQKQEINAKINASVNGISVDGQFEDLDESTKTNTKITVLANQIGGSAIGLTQIMSANILQCNLKDIDNCTDVVARLINYANADFKTSVLDDKWAILNYETADYEGLPYLEDNVIKAVSIVKPATIEEAIKAWGKAYDEANKVIDRANYLLGFTSTSLNTTQEAAINALLEIAKTRREGLYGLLESCEMRTVDCEYNIVTAAEHRLQPFPPDYNETLNPKDNSAASVKLQEFNLEEALTAGRHLGLQTLTTSRHPRAVLDSNAPACLQDVVTRQSLIIERIKWALKCQLISYDEAANLVYEPGSSEILNRAVLNYPVFGTVSGGQVTAEWAAPTNMDASCSLLADKILIGVCAGR